MPDTEYGHKTLDELAEVNPESLPSNTPAGFRFRYIDLTAAKVGNIDWRVVDEMRRRDAPSRAQRMIRNEDVLFGTVRPNLQSHGYIDEAPEMPLVASTGFAVVRAKHGVSDPAFLFHSLMGAEIARQANRQAVGSNYPAVNDGHVREFAIFAPLYDEQRAIARVLTTLDSAIMEKRLIVDKLKQVKLGLLNDLLTRGVDSNGELRPTFQDDPSKYMIGKRDALPCSWSEEQVHHVLQGIEAGKSPDCEDTPAKGDEWGVLKVGAVNPERFEPSENKVVKEKRLHNPAYLVREGDLLFSRANTYELVGLVSRVHRACGNLMLSDKTLRLQVRQGQMTATFLYWQLQHARSKSQIEIAATGTSGSMKNISQASLEKIWICRPPLEEQREIDARLAGISKRCTEEEELLSKLCELKIGLTEDLLTGRVRVTSLLER